MSEIMERVAKSVSETAAFVVEQFFTESKRRWKCESHIETAFAAALVLKGRLYGAVIMPSREEAKAAHERAYFLEPQATFGRYRADFLLGVAEHADDPTKAIIVECDGHDWHERTKEQATADKARDRYLSTQVARVLRFTGSEVFRDPGACSTEAMAVLNFVIGRA